jgi:hypothetical protein
MKKSKIKAKTEPTIESIQERARGIAIKKAIDALISIGAIDEIDDGHPDGNDYSLNLFGEQVAYILASLMRAER